jgi:hypothetical protein
MPSSIKKSPQEIALLLTLKPARTPAGAKVQAACLFRVEVSMWISEALNA